MGDLLLRLRGKGAAVGHDQGRLRGTENVGDTPCTHLAFQDVGVDWELWLPAQGDPLPKRFKVVQKKPHRAAGGRRDVHRPGISRRRSPTPRSSRRCRRTTRASPCCSGPRRSRRRGRAGGAASGSRASSQTVAGASAIPRYDVTRGVSNHEATEHDRTIHRRRGWRPRWSRRSAWRRRRRRCAPAGAAPSPKATTARWPPARGARPSRAKTATPRPAAAARWSAARKAMPRSAGTATS